MITSGFPRYVLIRPERKNNQFPKTTGELSLCKRAHVESVCVCVRARARLCDYTVSVYHSHLSFSLLFFLNITKCILFSILVSFAHSISWMPLRVVHKPRRWLDRRLACVYFCVYVPFNLFWTPHAWHAGTLH